MNQNIVDTALFLDNPIDGQGSLFLSTATLSESFFAQFQKHPVPLEEAAIRGLSNNSMGLDVYAWLAYRLHSLTGPTPIHWRVLMAQIWGVVAPAVPATCSQMVTSAHKRVTHSILFGRRRLSPAVRA